MKDQILLAIDPSTKSTGIAVFKNKELIYYNCISSSSTDVYKRIDKMIEGIKIAVDTYGVNYAVLEDVLPEEVKHNQSTFKSLTYLQGYILHTLNDYKLNWKFYTASQWRSICGIKIGPGVRRENLKKQDIAFVKKHYNIDVNDDIADAICIGYAELNPISNDEFEGFEFK